jgi:NAD(P)H-nitrite reductase large subunit
MRVVIIGAGPAGLSAAECLRQHDASIAITLISQEPFAPYSPPALVDYFLTGRDETLYWKGTDVCERLGLEHLKGVAVRSVRPAAHEVELEGGRALGYERLVVATGSRLHAPVRGCELPGVYNFKSLTAARALVDRVRQGDVRSALVVGAGFVGVEIALLLAELGVAVRMVEMEDRVMPRMLDGETAELVLAAIRRRGVEVLLRTRAAAFTGEKRATGVSLESGESMPADACIAATGLEPNVDFLAGTGVDVGRGIRVDDRLRASVPDVFAAGDVAETRDVLTGERGTHAIFPNAVAQGQAVAREILGLDGSYPGAESMNSLKHLGLPVIAVGAMEGDEVLRRRERGALRKIFLRAGRIVGFRLTGDVRPAGVLRSLMLSRTDVKPFEERLLDPSFGFGEIALSAAGAT